jgi:hypothetical protein
MGRGLSELQRHILVESSRRNRLHYSHILVGFFGWKCRRGFSKDDYARQKFSRADIGEAVYRRVMATLSRSCARLQARGLVTCLTGATARWSGVEITAEGREWLSVNTTPILRSVNR